MILGYVVAIGLTALITILVLNLRSGEKQIRYLIGHEFGVFRDTFFFEQPRGTVEVEAHPVVVPPGNKLVDDRELVVSDGLMCKVEHAVRERIEFALLRLLAVTQEIFRMVHFESR